MSLIKDYDRDARSRTINMHHVICITEYIETLDLTNTVYACIYFTTQDRLNLTKDQFDHITEQLNQGKSIVEIIYE